MISSPDSNADLSPASSPDPGPDHSPGIPPQGSDAAQTQDQRWLTALQESLVEALPRLYGVPTDPVVSEAIAALALAAGELECPLPPLLQQGQGLAQADGPDSLARLQRSALVQASDSPLVLQGQRLAWRRWQQRLQQVLDALIERAQAPPPPRLAGCGRGDRASSGDPSRSTPCRPP